MLTSKDVRRVQPLNAWAPMLVTVSARVTVVRYMQLLKNEPGTDVALTVADEGLSELRA